MALKNSSDRATNRNSTFCNSMATASFPFIFLCNSFGLFFFYFPLRKQRTTNEKSKQKASFKVQYIWMKNFTVFLLNFHSIFMENSMFFSTNVSCLQADQTNFNPLIDAYWNKMVCTNIYTFIAIFKVVLGSGSVFEIAFVVSGIVMNTIFLPLSIAVCIDWQ